MKIQTMLVATLAALSLSAGAASGEGSPNAFGRFGPQETSICEPDESNGYSVFSADGQPTLHSFTITNPCNSWFEFYFSAVDQANPDFEFFVPPNSPTITVGHDQLHQFGLDIRYSFAGGGNNSNVAGPCPPASPSKAGYLVNLDGTLEPFSCP